MAGFAANLSRGEDEQRVEQVVRRRRLTAPGGRGDSLSLIQMILLTHLKAEFEKKKPMFQAPQFYNDVLSSPLSPRGKLMFDHAL